MGKTTVIGVIGGRESSEAVSGQAEQVGREIAKAGARLICGGYGGVMAAACRGARAEGGARVAACARQPSSRVRAREIRQERAPRMAGRTSMNSALGP